MICRYKLRELAAKPGHGFRLHGKSPGALRSVFLQADGDTLPGLPAKVRQLAERARGEALAPESLVELAEAALLRARRLPTQDALATLAALERQNAEDPSVVSALAERIVVLANAMALEEALEATALLRRCYAEAPNNRRQVGPALQELELRLLECAREPRGFVRVLAGLAAPASMPETWLPANQRLSATLAALTPQLRGLSYHDLVSIELAFDVLSCGTPAALSELLRQQRSLFLQEAPLRVLLRELLEGLEDLPPWLLRSPLAEEALLDSFVQRLEVLSDPAAEFEDPFECFELLSAKGRLPSSFLRSLAAWVRRNLRRGSPEASARLITATRLCALDDSFTARGMTGCRETLEAAIRAFVIFGPPEKKCSALLCSAALKVAKEAAEEAQRHAEEKAIREEKERIEREEMLARAREAHKEQREKEEEFRKALSSDPVEFRKAAEDIMEADYGTEIKVEGRRGLPLRLLTRRKEVAWIWAGEVQELIGGGAPDDTFTQ
ncbi:LZTR1 [Symbiodinium sp. CCMP2456]|nr:LZTR1 [Symbiodinium sp. CCMP2456]